MPGKINLLESNPKPSKKQSIKSTSNNLVILVMSEQFSFSDYYRKHHKQVKKVSILDKFLKKDHFPQELKLKYQQVFYQSYRQNLSQNIKRKSQNSSVLPENYILFKTNRPNYNISRVVHQIFKILLVQFCTEDMVYFRAVQIMETYLQKFNSPQITQIEIQQVLVACILISCKYEGVSPSKLSEIKQKLCEKGLNHQNHIDREMKILIAIDYRLESPTIFLCLHHLFVVVQDQSKYCLSQETKSVLTTLAKIIFVDSQLTKESLISVATSLIFVGMRMQGKMNQQEIQMLISQICESYQSDTNIVAQTADKIYQLYQALQKESQK